MIEQAAFKLRGRNPDVLTCIANLSNDEVFTPPEFANRMLDNLANAWAERNDGANLWANSSATFLDPFAKSGVFLREITKRLITGLADEIPDLQERVDHILTRQVFGIGITALTSLLSRRSLYCSKHANGEHSVAKSFSSEVGNVWFERTEHSWQGAKCEFCGAPRAIFDREPELENHAYAFIHTNDIKARIGELFGADMQFDVIIGNPPYQMTGGGGGTNDSSIYHLFVKQAMELEPRYVSMVIPSRWMAGGRGMDEFRRNMLGDRHLRTLVDYPNSAQVFPGVDLKSGVCYFLWDREHNGDCAVTLVRDQDLVGPTNRKLDEFDVFIRDERAAGILKKVLKKGEPSFETMLTGDTPFGLATNFKSFRSGEPKDGEVKIYASSNAGRRSGAMQRDLITKNTHLIDAWKVLAPKAGPGNSGGHVLPDAVLGKPNVAEPNSVCTQTWIVAGPLKSEKQAEIVARYLQTSFVRFLVSLRKVSQDAMKGVYRWVPQQDWNEDWNDEKLYEKYGITADEIAYIDRMIRPMSVGNE
ncbi:MAG: Eco57I restriction-modification methylase domain-containing protein [Sphingomonadaceae bacterium]|nr:Eco57I restriction-modification methylase domain-containing protein [Sphingomonadaceae bacterium]